MSDYAQPDMALLMLYQTVNVVLFDVSRPTEQNGTSYTPVNADETASLRPASLVNKTNNVKG